MYIYRVTFGNGSKLNIRANSPKEAYERASKIHYVISHVKFLK